MKCQVPIVTDIVKREAVRYLVEETDNFANDSQVILGNLNVLLQLKYLVSQYGPLNSCNVPANPCPNSTHNTSERLEEIMSIATDLSRLVEDLQPAIESFFFRT